MTSATIPQGTVLFEGQGIHEVDVVRLLFPDGRCQSLVPMDGLSDREILRKRPTSTSYLPNVALDFVGHGGYSPDIDPPADQWLRHASEIGDKFGCFDPEAAAVERGYDLQRGCLVVHRIVGQGIKGLFTQGISQLTAPPSVEKFQEPSFAEAEITLQPGLLMKIDRAEVMELPVYQVGGLEDFVV